MYWIEDDSSTVTITDIYRYYHYITLKSWKNPPALSFQRYRKSSKPTVMDIIKIITWLFLLRLLLVKKKWNGWGLVFFFFDTSSRWYALTTTIISYRTKWIIIIANLPYKNINTYVMKRVFIPFYLWTL